MNRRIGGCCNQLLLEVRWTALSPFSISYHSQAGSTTVRSYQIWINQETDDREDSLKLVNDDSLLEVAGRLNLVHSYKRDWSGLGWYDVRLSKSKILLHICWIQKNVHRIMHLSFEYCVAWWPACCHSYVCRPANL